MPPPSNTPSGDRPNVNAEDADVWNNTATAEEDIADMSYSTRDRELLRDLNRLDRRREAEATDRTSEDETRRQRLQRVLARLSRLEDSRPTYGTPPVQQQSLYDWAPTRTNEGEDESEQAAARRRALYRRHDLRSAAIMQNARTTLPSSSGSRRHNEDTNETQDARSAYRRTYLADTPAQDSTPSTSPSRPSPLLESALKYLDSLRECSTYDESLCSALDHGLFAPESYDDLITDTRRCLCPQPSSWLAPGSLFKGTQHTTTAGKGSSLRSPSASDATRPWLGHVPIPYSRSIPPSFSGNPFTYLSLPPREIQDRWPVKVTIQAVNLQNMTIAGVMEAFDVPNTTHPSPETPPTPITTYLEGQIIDMNIHSFLTPANSPDSGGIAFPQTSALTDAAYWRNLPPFSNMKSDHDVARAILSRTQMEEIMSDWIFMRWKERCFIHSDSDPCHRHSEHSTTTGEGDDNDFNHGLTISGFYYVSLRRGDGNIDGLYFDTKTSPYQQLRLAAKSRGTLGSWQFK
ncbi:hypothetical protein D6D19_00754 [Aureobasidium pullulans]|uniref:Vacuolar import and degradation protein-domain-containing protein n=1 Tax=Aureobasidium pullulans TaxID=5580 RepID=A0A4S9LWP3_AURPU|nr:hypothetical protein D6D19_00754 [Aureobasidium pullulans]THY34260.1 hypothetical protein D6D00_00396 [Aureobasidium pullulans]